MRSIVSAPGHTESTLMLPSRSTGLGGSLRGEVPTMSSHQLSAPSEMSEAVALMWTSASIGGGGMVAVGTLPRNNASSVKVQWP